MVDISRETNERNGIETIVDITNNIVRNIIRNAVAK